MGGFDDECIEPHGRGDTRLRRSPTDYAIVLFVNASRPDEVRMVVGERIPDKKSKAATVCRATN
jgi:hypothetical protein